MKYASTVTYRILSSPLAWCPHFTQLQNYLDSELPNNAYWYKRELSDVNFKSCFRTSHPLTVLCSLIISLENPQTPHNFMWKKVTFI